MFDIIFTGMAAFQQAGMLLAGVLCLAIGGAVFGNGLYWRIRAERVDGTITGIRKKGTFYYPVYRYVMGSGEEREAISSTGIGSPRGMDTGKVVRLMVFPDKPEDVRSAGSLVYLIIGLFFLAPGALFVKLALFTYPVTPWTWGMLVALAAVAALKIRKHMIPKELRDTPAEWRAKRDAEHAKEWAAATATTLEEYRDSPEGLQATVAERKQAAIAMPILIIIGCAMMWGGYHFGGRMIDLTQHGLHAPGRVVSLDSSYDGDGNTTYHPVVEFQDKNGHAAKFRDSFGSSPASYRVGEEVVVLYLAEQSQSSATIDRGWMNWLLPGILGGFGLGAVLLGLSMARYRDTAA